jgi:hypothetical protein
MVVGVNSVDGGSARVAMLGIGHSVAYLLGAAVLFVLLRARVGRPLFPRAFWRALSISAVLGLAAWAAERAIAPSERVATAAVLVVIGVLGVGLYVAMLRMLPKRPALREAALEPTDPDLAVEL